jgi:hypothetical protein
VIVGTKSRFEFAPFFPRPGKKETDNRPSGGNAIAFEHLEQARDSFPGAKQVRAVRAIEWLMVSNAPVELKIERDYEGSIARPCQPGVN